MWFRNVLTFQPYDQVDIPDRVWRQLPELELHIADLVATQVYLSMKILDPDAEGRTDPIQVVKRGDAYYIHNGHHRVMRGFFHENQTTFKAHVLEWD